MEKRGHRLCEQVLYQFRLHSYMMLTVNSEFTIPMKRGFDISQFWSANDDSKIV